MHENEVNQKKILPRDGVDNEREGRREERKEGGRGRVRERVRWVMTSVEFQDATVPAVNVSRIFNLCSQYVLILDK